MDAYDQVAYPSHIIPSALPSRMAAIGTLFGVAPVPVSEARVLELGAASGGHLLPLAASYPNASFLGLERSGQQVAVGQAYIDALGLDNIRLDAADIMDYDLGEAQFDYIIAHGFYSWVPQAVQEKMFEILEQHLAPNGIAFVSYNTLPGWHEVRAVRDMMLFHSQQFEDSGQKADEARKMVRFIHDNVLNKNSGYQVNLAGELMRLQDSTDGYMSHDYLEVDNTPVYLETFVAQARAHDLEYLGDSELSKMYLGNFSEQAQALLCSMDDVVRQEQYMDYLSNQRFRSSLLVRKGRPVNHQVSLEALEEITFLPGMTVKEVMEGESPDSIYLQSQGLERGGYYLTGPFNGAVYTALFEAKDAGAQSVAQLLEFIRPQFPNEEKDHLKGAVLQCCLELLFKGVMIPGKDRPAIFNQISDKPMAFPLAALVAQVSNRVPCMHQDSVELLPDQQILLPLLNGARDMPAIVEDYRKAIDERSNGAVDGFLAEHSGLLPAYVMKHLHFFRQVGLLIA